MFRWIVLLLLAALILRGGHGFLSGLITPRRPAAGARHGRSGPGRTLVRDPVCGTFVAPSRALSARAGTTVHYFCSERCRKTFGRR